MDKYLAGTVVEAGVNAAADLYNGDPATDVLSLAEYKGARFLIIEGAGATGTATITVEECDDAVPTTTAAIPFRYRVKIGAAAWGDWQDATVAGFATTAGANNLYEIEVAGEDTSDEFPNVRLVATEVVNNPVVGAIVARLFGARFATEPPVSGLAT